MFQQLLTRPRPATPAAFAAVREETAAASDGAAGAAWGAQEPPPPARRGTDAWSTLDREFARAHRVANGTVEREDLEWLCRGFSAFLGSGGTLSLQRCLRLPTNEPALQRARRDHWLRKAWLLLDDTLSAWRRSELLATEVQRFQTGKWTRWSRLDGAPASASSFDAALFEAFRAHDRVPSTAMQLHNIAGQSRRADDPPKAKC